MYQLRFFLVFVIFGVLYLIHPVERNGEKLQNIVPASSFACFIPCA